MNENDQKNVYFDDFNKFDILSDVFQFIEKSKQKYIKKR